jgi:hypothetical protein
MELKDDELLVRRKRVNEYGEWEYECKYCNNWLLKFKFRGCIDYIDAYGNCLMCNSCKTKRGQQTQKANQKVELKRVFDIMGFDTESDVPIYKQFHQKYNLPLKRRDW